MLKILLGRLQQGHRTIAWPDGPAPALPDRFRGRPVIDRSRCPEGCRACAEACATQAISLDGARPVIDLGRCIFCPDCAEACPTGALGHSGDYRLAVSRPGDLHLPAGDELRLAASLEPRMLKLFGRSLKLRQVSAGGCNACEADINVLGTVGWDLGRFGIQLVASPRHADGLLVTGPVTQNMALALLKTWQALPAPKIVIAVGACALSGGLFRTHPETLGGLPGLPELPVDLYIPGCPPHPLTILDGLLRLLDRLEARG